MGTQELYIGNEMANQQIRINKTPDITEILAFIKEKYCLLSEADIMKMALSVLYRQVRREQEKKSWDSWEKTLPEEQLTDEAQSSLTDAIKEHEKSGTDNQMTAKEAMKSISGDS
jgi:hypothetical protein